LAVFSKRSVDIDHALAAKVEGFRAREGREPSRWERAALTREASADTRSRKSGHGAADLTARWHTEAAAFGWTAAELAVEIDDAGQAVAGYPTPGLILADIVERLAADRSVWTRADVVQAICDLQRPFTDMPGRRWLESVEHAATWVVERCVDLDPADETVLRRVSDGRSVWIEPTAPRFTAELVLAQEEHILAWAMEAQVAPPPTTSTTIDDTGLDVVQAAAAGAVAGGDGLGSSSARRVPARPACSEPPSRTYRHQRPVFGAGADGEGGPGVGA